MGSVNEKLLNELPKGLIGLNDAGYTITSLYKNNDEIECVMEYGSRESYAWTIYVGDAYDLRIRFKAVTNRETDLIDYLMKNGVDSENAKYFSDHVRIRYERLFDKVRDISGNDLSYAYSIDDDIYDDWAITIDRDVTDSVLGDLAFAVFDYVHFNERLLRKLLDRVR